MLKIKQRLPAPINTPIWWAIKFQNKETAKSISINQDQTADESNNQARNWRVKAYKEHLIKWIRQASHSNLKLSLRSIKTLITSAKKWTSLQKTMIIMTNIHRPGWLKDLIKTTYKLRHTQFQLSTCRQALRTRNSWLRSAQSRVVFVKISNKMHRLQIVLPSNKKLQRNTDYVTIISRVIQIHYHEEKVREK